MVSPTGVIHPLYHDAAEANLEVANLGRVLRHLDSTDWRFRSGSGHAAPEYVPTWNASAGDGLIDSLTINGETQAFKDALLGYFSDDGGQDYFMLVNAFHGKTFDASAATASFVLVFDPSINALLRINRLTGEPEKITLANHTLNLTLPGGTGDLFKYTTGDFAGIPSGDADLDGDVDIDDLRILADFYGITAGGRWGKADFDFDGDVDLVDLTRLATNYGEGQAQAVADFQSLRGVPEPTLVALLVMPAILSCRLSRRSRG
jgi:hypothetical protein